MPKQYLGDSVYVDVWGNGGLVLTTENGEGPSNTIYIDLEVFAALQQYVARRDRFYVVAERNHHAGDGWAIFDREQQRVTGGWFADRIAAERTAVVLNQSETP